MQPQPWPSDAVRPDRSHASDDAARRTLAPRPWGGALALLVVASALTWLSVAHWGLGLCDNGDGWRLMRRALIPTVPVTTIHPLSWSYRMTPVDANGLIQSLPRSTSGVAFFVVAMAHQAVGSLDFHLWMVTWIYHVAYLSGMFTWMAAPLPRGTRIIATLIWGALLLCPYTLALFHSPLEEAGLVALLPAWALAMQRAWHTRAHTGVALALSLGITLAKPQAFVLLPVVILTFWRGPRLTALWSTLMLVTCVAVLAYRSQVQHAEYNAFNRLSLGVADSLAHVSDWPVRQDDARRQTGHARVDANDVARLGLPPIVRQAWGQGFWPYCQPAMQEVCQTTSALGRATPFLKLLLTHPRVIATMASESWWTATRADYRMSYIYMQGWQLHDAHDMPGNPSDHPDQHSAAGLAMLALGHAGVLWWAGLALTLLAAWQRQGLALALGLLTLTSPMLVTLGDGYFEFERHLMPHLALVPAVGMLLLPVGGWRRRAATAEATAAASTDAARQDTPDLIDVPDKRHAS